MEYFSENTIVFTCNSETRWSRAGQTLRSCGSIVSLEEVLVGWHRQSLKYIIQDYFLIPVNRIKNIFFMCVLPFPALCSVPLFDTFLPFCFSLPEIQYRYRSDKSLDHYDIMFRKHCFVLTWTFFSDEKSGGALCTKRRKNSLVVRNTRRILNTRKTYFFSTFVV
jgi:hypothetical protein